MDKNIFLAGNADKNTIFLPVILTKILVFAGNTDEKYIFLAGNMNVAYITNEATDRQDKYLVSLISN